MSARPAVGMLLALAAGCTTSWTRNVVVQYDGNGQRGPRQVLVEDGRCADRATTIGEVVVECRDKEDSSGGLVLPLVVTVAAVVLFVGYEVAANTGRGH